MSSVSRPRWLRRLLLIVTAVAAVVLLSVGGCVTWVYGSASVSTVGSGEFSNELAIPPLAQSRVRAEGTRVFELEMRSGQKEFRAGQATATWGFNGDYLGPTLRARRGEK